MEGGHVWPGCNGAACFEGKTEVLADTRLKIAVFIDFDNIEIGVKSTLGVQFDIGVVLEALKERGDVVSKIAYGDWTRAGDYSRSLTQHATKLVQRNLTPGGDKNGADINLALDALEMAFTHSHINAYVVVGGDSDFITLVEKLKQYDKTIFVVGGRAFTSMVMQRNCHEFIAYENLVGSRRSSADRGRQSGAVAQQASIEQAVPLVRRALKVLSDREVSPQLGLLKSTLLQLDSTFSERTYGTGSFRDFAQKLAAAGHVTLKESGRNVLVELAEGASASPASEPAHPGRQNHARRDSRPAAAQEPAAQPETAPPAGEPRTADGVREIQRLFQSAQSPPRFPMYIRQAKQFLRNVDASFDERKYGFASLVDLLRACQREGLLRIERDRQGVMRIFAGTIMQTPVTPGDEDNRGNVVDINATRQVEEVPEPEWAPRPEPSTENEVVEADMVQEIEPPLPVVDADAAPIEAEQNARGKKTRGGRSTRGGGRGKGAAASTEGRPAGAKKTATGTQAPRARKTAAAKPRAPRTRARKEPA
jgi:uncharacterized LabA/DUF88 family protein